MPRRNSSALIVVTRDRRTTSPKKLERQSKRIMFRAAQDSWEQFIASQSR